MKQYKNVYTILEKVKKGEIQSYYKDKEGLFSRVNFYKKKDLIKPYLHYLDDKSLNTIVKTYINDVEISNDYLKNSKIPVKFNPNEFHKKVGDVYRSFPDNLEKDVFKMFYNKIDNIEFEDRTDRNKVQYKFIEKSNNPVSKIMSETSNLKSAIFTREIISQYAMKLAYLSFTDKEEFEKTMNDLKGDTDNPNSQQTIENNFNKMIDSTGGQQTIDQALKRASDLCKKLDDSMPEETQEKIFDDINKDKSIVSAGNLTANRLNHIVDNILSIKMSVDGIKNVLKKLLDRSVNQFSAKPKPIYEDLFNSDNISNLDDYLALHPKLRKFMAEDILIKDNKYQGKINIYIDTSGSMGDSSGITNPKNKHGISKIEFAKSFVAEMMNQNLLNNIYLFDSTVRSLKPDLISLSMVTPGGGTRIDCVIDHINRVSKCNSIVLTDAEDHCTIYDDRAFFIGIKGARFNYFKQDILDQYVDNQQLIVFDGKKILNVNKKGHAVG